MNREEINNELNTNSDLADEDEPQRLILPAHGHRSNLVWVVSTISKASPTNEDVTKGLIVSAYSTHDQFKTKVHVFVMGEYDGGKTNKMEKVMNLLPIKNRVIDRYSGKDIVGISPKFPYYSTCNIKLSNNGKGKPEKDEEGHVIPYPILYKNRVLSLDDIIVSDAEPLKRLANTSDNIPSWNVTSKENDGTKPMMVLDGCPVIWVTKCDVLPNDQVNSRFLKLINKKDVESVSKFRRTIKTDEELKAIDLELKAVKDFIADTINLKCIIKPTQEQYNSLPKPDGNRNDSFIMTMLSVIAKINAKDYSNVIVPTEEDLQETISFFKCETSHIQVKGVSKDAEYLLQLITLDDIDIKSFDNSQDYEGATVKSLQNKTPYSESKIKRLIIELENSNKIEVKPNRCNKKYFRKVI